MHRFRILPSLLAACCATALLAQAPSSAPKPDHKLKKLAVLVGHWTYEGEYKPGPLGPGAKIKGAYDAHMILGGFFLQEEEVEKSDAGEMRNLAIESYNPANKNFDSRWYQSDGSTVNGTLTINGNTITWAGTLYVDGKPYQFREPMVCSADFTTCPAKAEISTDGKTWVPFFETTFIKAKPAAKKSSR
jgi:hypothetical protein